jgi:uncharacterized protein YoxC
VSSIHTVFRRIAVRFWPPAPATPAAGADSRDTARPAAVWQPACNGAEVMEDLATTNVLIGIIAAVQVVFLLGALVALWYVRSAVASLQSTLRELEREHVRPLRAQAEQILADVKRVSARVETQAARVDSSVTATLDAAERQVSRIRSAVDLVARETNAVASGVRAAVSAVARRARRPDDRSGPDTAFPGISPVDVSHEEDLHASFR